MIFTSQFFCYDAIKNMSGKNLSEEFRTKLLNKFNNVENLKTVGKRSLNKLAQVYLNISSLRLKFHDLVE